jgi:hypothetical protein
MKIKNGFVIRKVGGASVVVPVGQMSKEFHGMINLNETGEVLWKFFTSEHTVDEAVAELLKLYEAEEEIVRKDVETFVNTIVEQGFAE